MIFIAWFKSDDLNQLTLASGFNYGSFCQFAKLLALLGFMLFPWTYSFQIFSFCFYVIVVFYWVLMFTCLGTKKVLLSANWNLPSRFVNETFNHLHLSSRLSNPSIKGVAKKELFAGQ